MACSVMCQRERLSILQEYNHTRWDVRLDMLISYVIMYILYYAYLFSIYKFIKVKDMLKKS